MAAGMERGSGARTQDPFASGHASAAAREDVTHKQPNRALAPWLFARLKRPHREREEHERQSDERVARNTAAAQQNREAAAAFFDKAQAAIEADDLPGALRRIKRAIDLHPPGGDAEAEATLNTYREWQVALFSAAAELEADDAREAAEEAASHSGHRGARRRPTKTAAQREIDAAEVAEAERRRARSERARREREVMEAADAEVQRRKDVRARRRHEADVARRRARVEAEEEVARRRAKAQANAEAAEACVQRAAEADDRPKTVRLLQKAVSLRPYHLRYRWLLGRAQLEASFSDILSTLHSGWAARSGWWGYAGALLTIALAVGLLGWLFGVCANGLVVRFCRPVWQAAPSGAARIVRSSLPRAELCAGGMWLDRQLRRVRAAHLVNVPYVPRLLVHPLVLVALLLPLAVAMVFTPAAYRRCFGWSTAWSRLVGLVSDVRHAVVSLGELIKWLGQEAHRRIDAWEQADFNAEQRARSRHRQQPQPQHSQQQHQQRRPANHSAWESEQEQQRQRRQRQQQQQQQQQRSQRAPPRPVRQPSETEQLRERARRLPPGAIRSVLLAATHYEALGISGDASAADAKKAYHRLALQLHPDKNKQPLAEDAFKRVEEARRTISDAASRREYDLTLPASVFGRTRASQGATYQYRHF